MPYVSRLKILGTLAVPELETTLVVHLINLEGSEETNFVYLSKEPIATDASPPAHLRFTCPDGQTKSGDILLWASTIRPRGPRIVHGCWVFDGMVWVKPDLDSHVSMEHPGNSEYQLVVLSGPLVKWELKPDPDREPSLTIPDPPRIRFDGRKAVNISPPPVKELRRLSRRTTRQSESTGNGPLRIPNAPDDKTFTSSAEQCGSRSESPGKKPHSHSNKTTLRNASWKSSESHRHDGFEMAAKHTDTHKQHEGPSTIIYAKRHRSPSPCLSSSKKRKSLSDDPGDPRQSNVDLDLLLQNMETALENRDDSPPPLVIAPPYTCTCALICSSQAQAAANIPKNDLEILRTATQNPKAALSVAHVPHDDQVVRLSQDLGRQEIRVCDLEASLRAAQTDFAEQKVRAGRREASLQRELGKLEMDHQLAIVELNEHLNKREMRVSDLEASLRVVQANLEAQKTQVETREGSLQRELNLAKEELGKKQQQESRLEDEVDVMNRRVEELQHAVAASADALEGEKDKVMHVETAKEMVLKKKMTQDLQSRISTLDDQHRSDEEIIIAIDTKLSTANATADRFRLEIFAQHAALIRVMQHMTTLGQKVRSAEERLEQEKIERLTLDAKLNDQRKGFREYLAVSDRERRTREQQSLVHQASLEVRLEEKTHELDSLQAKYSKLKDAYTSGMRELSDELSSCQTALEKTRNDTVAQLKAVEHGTDILRARTIEPSRDLDAACAENAWMKEMSLKECEKFQETLRATETRMEQESSKLREQLAEDRGERERIELEHEDLKHETKEKSRLLDEVQATCLRLTVDACSEGERHVAELSQKQAIHDKRMQSVGKELEEVRIKHANSLLDLATLRQEVQDALIDNTDLKQKVKATQSLLSIKDSERKSLQNQHAGALDSERRKREDAEKILNAVRRECREPFVIPKLLDLFVSAHREARRLSGE